MRVNKFNLVILSSMILLLFCSTSLRNASSDLLLGDFDIAPMAVYPINKAPEVNYLHFDPSTNMLEIDNTTKISIYDPKDYLQIGINISWRQFNISTWGGIQLDSFTLIGFSLDENSRDLSSPDYSLYAEQEGNPILGYINLYTNGSSVYHLFNFTLGFTARNGTNDFLFHETRSYEWVRWFAFIQFHFLEADTGFGAEVNTYSTLSPYMGSMTSALPIFQLNTTFSYASPPGSNNTTLPPDTPLMNYLVVGGLSAAVAGIIVGVIVRKRS